MPASVFVRTTAIAFAIAAALACNTTTEQDAGDAVPGPDVEDRADAREGSAREVTLTGCLQRGSGLNNFVLTRTDEPTGATRTGGAGGSVAQEQLEAARRSYRLEAEGDVDLDAHVGKQVRVVGTLGDRADLPAPTATVGSDERSAATLHRQTSIRAIWPRSTSPRSLSLPTPAAEGRRPLVSTVRNAKRPVDSERQ